MHGIIRKMHPDQSSALSPSVRGPWKPARHIRRENGALAVVPRTHHISSPYRGISFEPRCSKVQDLVRRFLEPVEVPLGQAVLFDARMLHCSLENRTEEDRAVVVSGIFPQGSEIVTCFREPEAKAPIELFRQPPEFLLRFPNFLHDCHARPTMSEVVGTVPAGQVPQPMTEGEFLAACRLLGIEARDEMPPAPGPRCHMIGEPR